MEYCNKEEVLHRIIQELSVQNRKQYELTEFLGLSEKNFGSWKAGLSSSYLKRLHAIAQFLNVSVEYLRGETNDKSPQKCGLFALLSHLWAFCVL